MGAGKKTQTFILNDVAAPPQNQFVGSASFRDLRKSHLGGVIFGCKTNTMKECLSEQLFGLPGPHFSFVKNIDPGLPLFLFNCSDRKLHGIFDAASSGQMNINPYGWTTDGSERTPYPAQVQIRVRLKCQPIHEDQFKPIIADNYYNRSHFWFELDHAQTSNLMALLSSQAVAPSSSAPQNLSKWRLPSPRWRDANDSHSPQVSTNFGHSYNKSTGNLDTTKDVSPNTNQSLERLTKRTVDEAEKDLMFMKLKELALNRKRLDSSVNEPAGGTAIVNDVKLEQKIAEDKLEVVPVGSSDYPTVIAQLKKEVEELKHFKSNQTQKMKVLEHKQIMAEREIRRLKNRCTMLEFGSNASAEPANETITLDSNKLHLDLCELIFLVGGYDGQLWLSALDSYSPSEDTIKSLRSMNFARSYASVAKLNGELYVFGGGNGSLWYDTVESYNPDNNEWTLRPSLHGAKGSLAGATVNSKIFALGGGNGHECFSEVEMLDLDLGRWILTQSTIEKRFALAAAELNGAIYAVGGFDGENYLRSAERFDPREHSWDRIESMTTRRGCHSLTVMNEKLYALGGFDGTSMVPSVEIFDPCLGKWMPGEPMNHPRGYSAAAVLKDSLYVIGGVISDDNIIDTVECYKEGQGWQVTNLEAVGGRCFASAIVLSK